MAAYRHFPALEELCDLAERTGLQVRIPASTDRVQFGRRLGEEYRDLTRVELWEHFGPTPLAVAPIYDSDLEAAALDLLTRVA